MSEGSAVDDRSRLESVLRDGIECMRGLKAVLVEERGALERRDPNQLAAAAKSKEEMVGKLAVFDRFKGEMASLADAPGSLADRWREFQGVARDCDRLNKTNGTIIRARHQQVRDGLSLLRGCERNDGTYTPTGSPTTAIGRHTLTEA